MAWRAAAQAIKLPDDLADIEVEEDENDESGHSEFVMDVIGDIFESEHLRPGLYNVAISGHTNKTEDDNADNINIRISRTVG